MEKDRATVFAETSAALTEEWTKYRNACVKTDAMRVKILNLARSLIEYVDSESEWEILAKHIATIKSGGLSKMMTNEFEPKLSEEQITRIRAIWARENSRAKRARESVRQFSPTNVYLRQPEKVKRPVRVSLFRTKS
ncbi:MAG: hypothetical protein PHU42_01890 [Patescibacteria group bacterium]|nr:hypothetical protein [Patescibacteria group bacterium]